MGRNAVPTKIKKMTGNPGKRKLNEKEPEFKSGKLQIPDFLRTDEIACKEWKRILKVYEQTKLLTEADIPSIACYCEAWSRWVRAVEIVSKQGFVLSSDNGGQYYNMNQAIADKAKKELEYWSGKFGMTPVSRVALKSNIETPEDEYGKFQKEGKSIKDEIKDLLKASNGQEKR